jgi:tRNA threonylcarbamoyladenosine biosynthesis protein TsaE
MTAMSVKGNSAGAFQGDAFPPGGTIEVVTHSSEETEEFGRQLAARLQPCLVSLEGELGSGKTTLTKGIVAGLGAARSEEVTSPSFTLVHEYGGGRVYHIDLYRVETAQEQETLGLEEVFAQKAIVVVEWGEKLSARPAGPMIRVRMEYTGNNERRIRVENVEG